MTEPCLTRGKTVDVVLLAGAAEFNHRFTQAHIDGNACPDRARRPASDGGSRNHPVSIAHSAPATAEAAGVESLGRGQRKPSNQRARNKTAAAMHERGQRTDRKHGMSCPAST